MQGGVTSPVSFAIDAWWDASDLATITNAGSGKVSSLLDKSGNGYHMLQTVGGNRPTTGTRTQNSLNLIDFVRASNQFLDAGDALDIGADGFSIFLAGSLDNVTSLSGMIGKHVAGGTDGRWGLYHQSNVLYGMYDSDASATGAVSRSSDITTSFRLLSNILDRAVGVNASTNTLRIDRTTVAVKTFTDTATSWDTTEPFRIGRYGTYTSGDMDGAVGEAIVVMRTLSDVERDEIESYLATKWGTP